MMTERQRKFREHDTICEFRIVFFPRRVLIVLAVFGALFAWVASVLINPNAGCIVFIGTIGHCMVHETFHFCCYVHNNWFVFVHWPARVATFNGSRLISHPIA